MYSQEWTTFFTVRSKDEFKLSMYNVCVFRQILEQCVLCNFVMFLLLLHDISASTLLCFATEIRFILAFMFQSTMTMMPLIFLGGIYSCIQLCLLKSVGNRQHISPLTRSSIRSIENIVVQAPCVQSHWCTFNVDHWSLSRSYHIVLLHSHSLNKSRI